MMKSTASMTPSECDVLKRAATLALAGTDLRYEGGSWVDVADRCCEAGWLRRTAHGEHDYFVSYFITEAGRAVLEQGTAD